MNFKAAAAHTLGVGFASRVLLSYVLETCAQANLQTALLAISRGAVGSGGARARPQALASVALGTPTTPLKLRGAKALLSAAPRDR